MANKHKKTKSSNCFQKCRTRMEGCVESENQKYDCDMAHYQCMQNCLLDG